MSWSGVLNIMIGRLQFLAPLCISLLAASSAYAETPKPKASTPAKPNATQSASNIPDPRQLNLLIRTTIIAFNQANQTGNYSVLRDLGAPSFQFANSPAKLARIFSNIRHRNLDLSPILYFDPKLIRQPTFQQNGLLRLSGFFDTRPERVVFDLQFQRVNTSWRLFGISVETRVAEDAQAPQAKTAPKKKSAPKKAAGKKPKSTGKAATSKPKKPAVKAKK